MKSALPTQREISATEKLLQSIRGKAPSAGSTHTASDHEGSPSSVLSPKSRPSRLLHFHERIAIGIDFGNRRMRFVKVTRSSERAWKVLACENVPYKPHNSIKDEGFADFFKTRLLEFSESLKKVEIWASVPSTQLDVKRLLIPRVPKKQIHNAVFWTIKKETSFDFKENVYDYEIQGEVTEKGIPKIAVLAYTVPRADTTEVQGLFEKCGLPLTGLSVAPFANQNLFRTGWLPSSDRPVACLYIGTDNSRIDIFKGSCLVFTRGIKAGISSMTEAVLEGMLEQRKAPLVLSLDELSIPTVSEEQGEVDREEARKLLLDTLAGAPHSGGQDSVASLTQEHVFRTVHPPLERIVRQVERTFKHFSTLNEEEGIDSIHVASSAVLGDPFISLIGRQLGIKSERLDPLAHPMGLTWEPESGAPRSATGPMATALGLAVSDNSRTPNLIFTFEARQEQSRILRINTVTFVAFLALVAVFVGLYFHQTRTAGQKRLEIARLNELLQSAPTVNQALVSQLAAKVMQQRGVLKDRARSLMSVAVLGELSSLTPAEVRLTAISLDFSSLPDSKGKEAKKDLTLEGIVRGEKRAVESLLARYLVKLSGSPMIASTQVQTSNFEHFQDEGEVLRFVMKLELS